MISPRRFQKSSSLHHRTSGSAYGGSSTFRQRGCAVVTTYPTIACPAERLVTDGSGKYPTVGYAPITLVCIAPLIGVPLVYAASDEVPNPRPWSLPRFPDAHTQPATKPLVYGIDFAAHVG